MKVKSEREVAQSCLTLSDPVDYSPPGSSIHGIFQAGVLEWGASAFSVGEGRGVALGLGDCLGRQRDLQSSASESRSVTSDSLRPHGLQPTRLILPWDFPGKGTGVGCHRPLHY